MRAAIVSATSKLLAMHAKLLAALADTFDGAAVLRAPAIAQAYT
jgi:hypothetical protein